MAHLALYRKYRPSGFEHLLGQDHIKKTLLNAINQDSISHAYVFSGPRGTGKTSSAKLFAKAVNCTHGSNGEPCGKCEVCNDSNPDIIEIDAASNNGVDEIRDLRDKIGYTPVSGKYKVYIIDEVHMLTIGAFNALLKTLEEPPKHAIFILATTEPHKIPLTILSRCQRFDFKRITDKAIVERMQYIIQQESVEVESAALEIIARVAQGGMRDALSLLDQAISHSDGNVTLNDVIELTGTVDLGKIGQVVTALDQNNTSLALDLLDGIVETGKEPKFFLDDLLAYYRDILVYRRVGEKANLTKALTDQSFKKVANGIQVERIYSIIDILSACQNQIKYSGQDKVLLEVALIKASADNPQDELSALKREVASLKRLLASGKLPELPVEEETASAMEEQPFVEEELISLDSLSTEVEQLSNVVEEENINFDGLQELIKVQTNDEVIDSSTGPELVNDELEAFVRQMDGENVAVPPKDKTKKENIEKELMELAGEYEEVEESSTTEASVEDDTFDILSQWEAELNGERPIQASTEESVEKSPENDRFSMSFIEKIQQDIENGADYIEIVDELPISDDLVPPESIEEEENVETPPVERHESPVDVELSVKGQKVLDILAQAKREYRIVYKEKNEEILMTLKKERMSVMSLYREAKVQAVSDKHIVVSVGAKPQVKLLEKVMNRSIIQGVLEECLGRGLELVVLDDQEWNKVLEKFKKN